MATPILDDLSAGLLLYVILVVAIDYTIKGLAGFGSGLIAVPLRSPGPAADYRCARAGADQ